MMKNIPEIAKSGIFMLFFSERCYGNICNLNVIHVVVLDFICRSIHLLFAILFSSKFLKSIFYQYPRPKSGLKSPRPLFKFVSTMLPKEMTGFQYY